MARCLEGCCIVGRSMVAVTAVHRGFMSGQEFRLQPSPGDRKGSVCWQGGLVRLLKFMAPKQNTALGPACPRTGAEAERGVILIPAF